MNSLRTIWRRLRSLGRRAELTSEIDEEIRFHLEQRTAENINAGMSPKEAAREARKRFGNLQTVREKCRESSGLSFGEMTWQDVRFGARMLWKNPGYTAIAALTLALGIGANTTMFSVVNVILFRPLEFPDSDRLMRIYRISSQSPRDGHSIGVFSDVREQNTVFEKVAAYYPSWPANLAEPGQPAELLSTMLVTADFFPVLGVQPELGRAFAQDEDQPGREGVIVLSHELWQRRFNSDRQIIGRRLRLDGENVTIVGVMPERMENTMLWGRVDLLRPFAFAPDQRQSRGDNWRFAIGRLKPGITVAQANAELSSLAGRFAKEYPKTEEGYGLRGLKLSDSISEESGLLMWLSLGLAGFVLLIACANLANLLLARLSSRTRELAVRAALGAGRGRLQRQLLTESFLISLIGGVLGLLIAAGAKHVLSAQLQVGGEQGLAIPLDVRVLGFTALSCVIAAALFGSMPAWLATRKDLNRDLNDGSRGHGFGGRHVRWRHALVIGEVALALVLLAGAGAFVRGLQQSTWRDPGWRVDGLLTAQLDLTSAKYKSADQRRAFYQEFQARLEALPGVQSVAISSRPPVLGPRFRRNIAIEGELERPPGHQYFVGLEPVTPSYFETVGLQLKAGRIFTDNDNASHARVAIINETMARQCWPNESPLGKRIRDTESTELLWEEVVGVVSDKGFPAELAGNRPQAETYRPLAQETPSFAHAELRVAGPMQSVAAALRRTVTELDPDQSTYRVISARELIRRETSSATLLGGVLAGFAALGLALAAVGIYGVVSYTVAQRTGEIGLRLALGAGRRDMLWLVLRQGLVHSLSGALIGLVGAYGIVRLLNAALPFAAGTDFLTLGGVAFLLISVAALACFIPARRASRLAPMQALRCE